MSERPAEQAVAITVRYRNHRGEVAVRHITPRRVYLGSTEYHPERQWLLDCYDHDRDADRTYALRDCDFTEQPLPSEEERLRKGLEGALGVSFTVGLLRYRAQQENDAELHAWGEKLKAQLVAIREVLSPGTAAFMAEQRQERPHDSNSESARRAATVKAGIAYEGDLQLGFIKGWDAALGLLERIGFHAPGAEEQDDDQALTPEGCTVEEAAISVAAEPLGADTGPDRWGFEEGWRCGRKYERARSERHAEQLTATDQS